ncbi:MAG TPA: PLP-dependent transferase, partial [Burkholderiaceae bacterium]|nr:PLP-dependent transferase [Burkholderiaceae bacterium]
MKARMEVLRLHGAALAPLAAFLLLQGIETLALRMQRHCENARRVAQFLESHPRAAWVSWPGLRSSAYYELARRTFRPIDGEPGASGVLTFGIRGASRAGQRFIEHLTLLSHLANIGDAKSLVIHPASTTHRQLSDEQQLRAGVTPDMIRISVGLEAIEDILWDLEQALQASAAD